MQRIILAAVFAVLAPIAAADGPVRGGDAWARATAPGAPNGGVFMKLENTGKSDDRLLRATAEVSASVELHTHRMEGGVAQMRAVPAIDLPAGKTVELKPGGLHVMLIGLGKPLREGERFPLALQFEKAGRQTVEVSVRGIGAGTGHDAHRGH